MVGDVCVVRVGGVLGVARLFVRGVGGQEGLVSYAQKCREALCVLQAAGGVVRRQRWPGAALAFVLVTQFLCPQFRDATAGAAANMSRTGRRKGRDLTTSFRRSTALHTSTSLAARRIQWP